MTIILNVEDFSCIRQARLELAPITVLIGPQGSGKSLTIKLLYFFQDILARQFNAAEKDVDLDEYRKDTVRLFKTWFPPTAWGKRRFNINFAAGPFTVRVLRRMSKGDVTDDVAITFSDYYKSQYNDLVDAFLSIRSERQHGTDVLRRTSEASWRLREKQAATLSKDLGDSYIDAQTFVPAGRAFFTSIGRLVAAIEQGSSLDPVTIRFAKLFASLRDYAAQGIRFQERNSEDRSKRRLIMNELFGGEIKFERDLEFVETSDGRKVPFTALSSGQQELLPMWLLVDFYADRSDDSKGGDIFYIEEPEAHLFPVAQSRLMEFLIGQLVSRKSRRRLIITTHSPYILAKLNTFLKAGILGRSRRNTVSVDKIVARECWIAPNRMKAFAIDQGYMKDLIDNDNLIDAHYIDAVSDEVSNTFSKLLDIEYPETVSRK